jgi:UDP-N-acetylmuramate dehydrogenase
MKIRENVLISGLTTMRLGGAARFVLEVESKDDAVEAFRFAKERGLPVWMMGGGANTLGHDEGFPGVVILNKLRGVEIVREENGEMILRGMGGEIWDDFVKFACERGYSGIEAMSIIPGTLGAAPVQNIGAYGQDIAQAIESVEAFDTQTGEFVTLGKDEMNMSYRHTRFNTGEDAGRFFIVAVTVKLKEGELEPPFYNSLQKYIDEHGETDFSPKNIRKMVSEIRSEKLPDPEKVASAGSFFKNVYVDKAGADAAEAQGIPLWRNEDGSGKINSGWLVEACGLKGKAMRGIRVSDKAALVLINESAKSYADLAAAREEIVGAVAEKFGLVLEQEPVEMVAHSEQQSTKMEEKK